MTPTLRQARQYLARVLPWPQDGDPPAFANVHWTFVPKDYDLKNPYPWSGRACRSLDEAVNAVEWAANGGGARDIYVCLSTQRSAAKEKKDRDGRTYYTPMRGQANAVALKCLYLDIDFKDYNAPKEAVRALTKFLKEAELPQPSIIVRSGGGLHIYFTLARPLPPNDWQPLANALAEAARQHGLKADLQCTVDCARVLRTPGTFNRKLDTPRPVELLRDTNEDYSVEALAKALEAYRTAVPARQSTLPQVSASVLEKFKGIDNDLSAAIENTFAPIKLDDIARECAFVRDAIATGGLIYTQPMWNLTTLISVFTEGGRADAHRMGDKHPGYSKESTDLLFDRKEKEKTEKGLGWPSCAAISNTECPACKACKHLSAGKSPFNHAVRFGTGEVTSKVTEPPTISASTTNDVPHGYIRDGDGIIHRLVGQDDGSSKLVPLCQYSMEEPWLQSNPEMLHFTSRIERNRNKQISIPLELINTQEMRKHLQSQGFMLPVGSKAAQDISEFMMGWIKSLRETRDTVRSAPFGWTVKNGEVEGFVYANRIWTPAGDRPAVSADPVIADQYHPCGNIQPWKDAANIIIAQERPELEALVASAFAAPLVRFTAQPGVLLSAYSIESGIGKSTGLKVGQAVWGDPIRAVQSLSDTQNAVMNKLGQIHSLPLYWDELKTEDDTRKFVNITFQMTQGKEKARMTRNVSQREPGSWQTLLVSASNDSLLDYVLRSTNMTTAGLYRVFEYVVTPPQNGTGQIDTSEASLAIARLADNYGMVGLEYAKFLGANHQRISKEVGDYLKTVGRRVKTIADERYWLALIAVICSGARYANELGFANFHLEALETFMLRVLDDMRKERARQPVDMKNVLNVSNVLASFLNEMRARHTLWTNRIHVGQGKPAPNSILVARQTDTVKLDGIFVHVGVDDKLLRISSTRLSEWLREKGYSRHLFTKALGDELGMKQINGGRIGSGTQFAGAKEYLLEIDLAGTPHG